MFSKLSNNFFYIKYGAKQYAQYQDKNIVKMSQVK